jgi:hypothetical protein
MPFCAVREAHGGEECCRGDAWLWIAKVGRSHFVEFWIARDSCHMHARRKYFFLVPQDI